MMAKLNGASTLPAEAQRFLMRYRTFLTEMTEAEASEATIALVYKSYYAEMGGVGTPPKFARVRASRRVQRHRVPTAARPRPKPASARSAGKTRLPVALIFICLVVVYVGFSIFWR